MATYKDYMLFDKLPHTWCAGCGDGIILQSIAAVFAEMELDKHDITLVSGIGCFGRVDDYLDINCMHVTHGRALAAATGVALGNPELNVLVTMGDGDGTTIGGNHLIHCARRNIDLTPTDSITSTSPYGHIEQNFDICKLAEAAGASYVARSTAYNPVQMRRLIRGGMEHKGFALIEVMVACPTHYGRYNRQGEAADMMKLMDEQSIPVEKARTMTEEELEGRIVTGLLVDKDREDYYTKYKKIIDAQNMDK